MYKRVLSLLKRLRKIRPEVYLAVFFVVWVGVSFVANIGQVNAADEHIPFTPSDNNFFTFVPPEYAEEVYGCPVRIMGGTMGTFVRTLQVPLMGDTASNMMCEDYKGRNQEVLGEGPKVINYYDESYSGLFDYVTMASGFLLEQKPISGRNYVEEKVYALSNFGDVSAQDQGGDPGFYYPGTGYQLLSPIQGFWGWSVNIVYGFLILLIVIVAFAIMFRARLGGGTAVTIQNAIPNIALAMILVPLSYAITGLTIDAITLGTNVAHEFLIGDASPGNVVYASRNCTSDMTDYLYDCTVGNDSCIEWNQNDSCVKTTCDEVDSNLNGQGRPDNVRDISDNFLETYCGGPKDVAIFGSYIENVDRGLYADDYRINWYSVWDSIDISNEARHVYDSTILNNGFAKAINDFLTFVNGIADIGEDGTGGILGGWLADLTNLVIQIILFLTGFRIFWILLKKFVLLLILPIFSPFIFATIAIPGNGTKTIMTYIKGLGAIAAFYIVAYSMILLAILLVNPIFFGQEIPDLTAGGGSQTVLYVPPILGFSGLAGIVDNIGGDAVINLVLAFASIAIFLAIPGTLKGIDAALGTDKSILTPILNNTWQSAKDSINLANTGRKMALTTPGAIADSFDRLRGREPGSATSVRGFMKRRSQGVRSGLGNLGNNLTDYAQRSTDQWAWWNPAKYAARGAAGLASGAAGLAGSAAGAASGANSAGGASGEKANLTAKVSWGKEAGAIGFVNISTKQMQGIVKTWIESQRNPVTYPGLGSVKLELENGVLPTINSRTMGLYNVDTVKGTSIEKASSRRSVQIGAGNDIFGVDSKSGNAVTFVMESGDNPSDGKAAKLDMKLIINDPATLFGYTGNQNWSAPQYRSDVIDPTKYSPERALINVAGKSIVSDGIIFKMGNVESNSAKVIIQLTQGQE